MVELVRPGRVHASGTFPISLAAAPEMKLFPGTEHEQHYMLVAVVFNNGQHWWCDVVNHCADPQLPHLLSTFTYDGLMSNGALRYCGPDVSLSTDERYMSCLVYRRLNAAQPGNPPPEHHILNQPIGLRNTKTKWICFLSAALQLLCATPNLYLCSCGPMNLELGRFIQAMRSSRTELVPENMLKFMQIVGSQFAVKCCDQQTHQDCSELLLELLGILKAESAHLGIEHKTFAFEVTSSLHCSCSTHASTVKAQEFLLILPVSNLTYSLKDCLDAFRNPQSAPLGAQCPYQKCGGATYTSHSTTVEGSCLLFCLQRTAWDQDQAHKVAKLINFPMTIDLSEWGLLLDNRRGQGRLYAVIVHSGTGVHFGHYVAYVKRNKEWFKCDDNTITLVSAEDISSLNPFILAYEVDYSVSGQATSSHNSPIPSTCPKATRLRSTVPSTPEVGTNVFEIQVNSTCLWVSPSGKRIETMLLCDDPPQIRSAQSNKPHPPMN